MHQLITVLSGFVFLSSVAFHLPAQTGKLVATSEAVSPATRAHSFTITNTGKADITGMEVVTVRHWANTSHPVNGWYFYDCFLEPQLTPIAPGQSYTFDVGADNETDTRPMEVFLGAAIFGDGNADGKPQYIRSLWQRRQWLKAGFEEIFHQIDSDVQDQADRDKLVTTLVGMEKSTHGSDYPERGTGLGHERLRDRDYCGQK